METLSTKPIGENGRGLFNSQAIDNIYLYVLTRKIPGPLNPSQPAPPYKFLLHLPLSPNWR